MPVIPIIRLAIVAAMFGAWELAPGTGLVDPRILPSFSAVLSTLIDLLGQESFWSHITETLAQTIASFVIAVPLGLVLGILIAENRFAYEVFKPLVFFVFSIPKSIFLPLFVLVLGITFAQKVAFGVFSTIFIVMMTAFAALESVRREYLLVGAVCGATKWQMVSRIYLPSMTPVILEAIRLAMIFNFTGILLAQMYASRAGLGNVIASWGQGFRIEPLLAAVLLVAAFSIVFNECVRLVESKLEHWRG